MGLKSCHQENMLVSIDSRRAFLKMVEDWIRKGFVTCPFKEPPLSDFRVHCP
jgi:hypothetical protein